MLAFGYIVAIRKMETFPKIISNHLPKYLFALVLSFTISAIYIENHSIAQEVSQWQRVGLSGMPVNSLTANESYLIAGTVQNGAYRLDLVFQSEEQISLTGRRAGDEQFIKEIIAGPNNKVLIATSEGIHLSIDGGESFAPINGISTQNMLPQDCFVSDMAAQFANEAKIVVGCADGAVYISEDEGNSWRTCGSGLSQNEASTSLMIPTLAENKIVLSTLKGIYEIPLSCTDTSPWQQIDVGLVDLLPFKLAFHEDNPSTYYLGTNKGVYAKVDGSTPWALVDTSATAESKITNEVVIHPLNTNLLFTGTNNLGVFKTARGGDEWNALNNQLNDQQVNTLLVHPDTADVLFAGTPDGVIRYENSSPEIIELTGPNSNIFTNTESIQLEWQSPADFEDDALHYLLEIATDPLFPEPIFEIHFSLDNSSGFDQDLPLSKSGQTVRYLFDKNAFPGRIDNKYYWRVSAWDGLEFGPVSEHRSFTSDTTKPQLDNFPPDNIVERANEAYQHTYTLTDNVAGLSEVIFRYRIGGVNEEWIRHDYDLTGNPNSFPAEIPSTAVGEKGVVFFIEGADFAGNTIRYPETSYNSIMVQMPSRSLIQPDRVASSDSSGSADPLPARDYQLVTIPLELADDFQRVNQVLERDLGRYDRAKYRVVKWDTTSRAYVDFSEDEQMTFAPGVGYWAIVKDDGKRIHAGPGNTVRMDEPFEIDLAEGWNIFGNPFNFSISLDSLVLSTGTSLRNYADFKNDEFGKPSAQIEPWEAYFIKVPQSMKLFVHPGIPAPGQVSTINTKSDTPDPLWSVQIKAKHGFQRDDHNFIGNLTAGLSEQQYSQEEPPAIEQKFRSYFARAAALLSIDYREENVDGASWQYVLEHLEKDVPLTVTFENVDSVPVIYDLILFDAETGKRQDLRFDKSYLFVPHSDASTNKKLSILMGSSDYIREQEEILKAQVDSYGLEPNFPNPLREQTTIIFRLPEEALVNLEIYNLLGQQITTLIDQKSHQTGAYTIQWDGTDNVGKRVPSGIYFYKFEAGLYRETRKMVVIH